ncbi:exodeoxyribonuclease III [Williamsia sp. CHRR-6]|uniref:exodeoxyribonuclease III n=1 Tax=Williamsia sp. CHRR-6 TaxID=2835871 RepID=UPI001BD9B9F1|nr:exodeoxyribonuclease III [Williamsia sp. CHRR-6]MBT0566795.1 endonuclease/exonuclease/phosphatase family protein [Williamsia sp. CHRR-6]
MSRPSLTVTTVNVNGVRAAVKQRNPDNPGLLPWLGRPEGRRFVLLQEIRASYDQATEALAPALEAGWHLSMSESRVKGHAGVGVLSTVVPERVRVGFGSDEFDDTGRYLEIDVAAHGDGAPLTLGSLYLPKGAADGAKRDEKFRFMAQFADHLTPLSRRRRDVVVGGDWNIAHTELDLKNAKGNVKNPGFLPEERAWVDEVLSGRWVDVARETAGEVPGPYSWWSWRGKAFDNDAGWRIDYQLVTPALATRVIDAHVERASAYDRRWSDHAPVTVTYR